MKKISITVLLIIMAVNIMQSQQSKKQPNVIIVFIDDMGYGDLGTYGATGYTTPNIDKMAAEGMKFTNFYVAQPVCSASRAGLLTGCYPNRISFPGVIAPGRNIGINPDEYTIAEMFKEQGYRTAAFGKWHVGDQKKFLPLQQGFDEFLGLPYSNDFWPRNSITGEKLAKGNGRYDLPELPLIQGNDKIGEIKSMADQDNLTTLYTEKAVDFINKNSKKPFFVYLAHSMGHVPLGVSKKFKGKSEQGLYGDVVMELDWSLGQINKALKENKIEDNTIVIFTSDNGPWLSFGNHAGSAGGLREGKMTSWEGGQRVPFIIKWPGVTPNGTVCDKLGSTIDLLPTFASIIKGKLSNNKIDGVNITSLFKGDFSTSPRESILYYFGNNNLNAVRKGNWKLVFPHKWKSYETKPGNDGKYGGKIDQSSKKAQLFDMTRDPGERYDVIEEHPEIVKEIMVIAEKARKELGDKNVGISEGTEMRAIGTIE